MKILTIKKRILCSFLSLLILISILFGIIFAVKTSSTSRSIYTIVIDAGHGGVDVKLGQYILKF